jgi:hypothetical protein
MSEPKFKRGDRVFKKDGRYGGPGVVVGATAPDSNGYRLYNVAMMVAGGYGYFVHVFPDRVLEPLADDVDLNGVCAGIEYWFKPRSLPSPPEQGEG